MIFVIRMKKVNLQEQFIMAYGGLRGGVGFSLVRMVDSEVVPTANMFVTTLLMVVLATVWIQGSTIKGTDHLIHLEKIPFNLTFDPFTPVNFKVHNKKVPEKDPIIHPLVQRVFK